MVNPEKLYQSISYLKFEVGFKNGFSVLLYLQSHVMK